MMKEEADEKSLDDGHRRALHTVGAHSICTGVEAVTAPHVNSSIQSSGVAASEIRILFDTCLVLGDEEARFRGFFSDITLYLWRKVQINPYF